MSAIVQKITNIGILLAYQPLFNVIPDGPQKPEHRQICPTLLAAFTNSSRACKISTREFLYQKHYNDNAMISDKVKLTNIFCVRESTIHGSGLFSKTRIRKENYLGTYSGRKAVNNGMHVLWTEQEDGSWKGRHGQNILRFLNHSHSPSCEFIGFDLYALRDIHAGEGVTIHYGPGFDCE